MVAESVPTVPRAAEPSLYLGESSSAPEALYFLFFCDKLQLKNHLVLAACTPTETSRECYYYHQV
jgi:hypothetical protein